MFRCQDGHNCTELFLSTAPCPPPNITRSQFEYIANNTSLNAEEIEVIVLKCKIQTETTWPTVTSYPFNLTELTTGLSNQTGQTTPNDSGEETGSSALSDSSGCSAGCVAGVVFGVLLVIMALIIAGFIYRRRLGHKKLDLRCLYEWSYINRCYKSSARRTDKTKMPEMKKIETDCRKESTCSSFEDSEVNGATDISLQFGSLQFIEHDQGKCINTSTESMHSNIKDNDFKNEHNIIMRIEDREIDIEYTFSETEHKFASSVNKDLEPAANLPSKTINTSLEIGLVDDDIIPSPLDVTNPVQLHTHIDEPHDSNDTNIDEKDTSEVSNNPSPGIEANGDISKCKQNIQEYDEDQSPVRVVHIDGTTDSTIA